ncbi:unnamed protein product [Rotaria sp. Silwood1]|nr:unnamed protein product [Rotaria sp. Silwood1]
MLKCGEITEEETIVTASGGNFAQGVTVVAVLMDPRIRITVPERIGEKRTQLIRIYGAEVHLYDSTTSSSHSSGGYEAVAKEFSKTLNSQEQKHGRKYVSLNQFCDHRNSISHHVTADVEIARQLNRSTRGYFDVVGTSRLLKTKV